MELKNNDWKHFLTQAGVSSENIHKYSEQLNAEGASHVGSRLDKESDP